jgi:hypothetical protein
MPGVKITGISNVLEKITQKKVKKGVQSQETFTWQRTTDE